MSGGTLIVEWGKNTRSETALKGRNLTLGLGVRKKLKLSELKTCKDFHPNKMILVSKQDGGIGQDRLIYYASEWTVSFEN
ncbi:MAG: hypothetical protein P1Q69_01710 [Candidatus Thorarchaeota archaeon]|nr:hypothetical protein [Candidatus Thorarchaeota archaeon]